MDPISQSLQVRVMTPAITLERELSFCNVRLRRLLVGVRAVTERGALDDTSELVLRTVLRSVLLPEVATDCIIVLGSLLECLQGELAASDLSNIAIALLPRLEELSVIAGVRQDRDALMVLGGSAEKGDTTDVDLLYSIGKRAVRLCDRLSERV